MVPGRPGEGSGQGFWAVFQTGRASKTWAPGPQEEVYKCVCVGLRLQAAHPWALGVDRQGAMAPGGAKKTHISQIWGRVKRKSHSSPTESVRLGLLLSMFMASIFASPDP